ncbi:type I DNA topoisomerase [Candidatus Chloroploca sp. Khr17]|uniref:type I DNA topoisomerase n=1 Tax=Candidatus Chloroploca sp. Khr17 TaxID=2496869 RepID=UPI00101B5C85|nr:type I DNA topoisomerase [Candidatus Chloroploca sp. Khr17]
MGDKLVIVESPSKAKTIQKYLGRGYRVTSSMGHVRDLPKSDLAIDVEHNFQPVYEVTKEKVVNELRQAMRNADAIYLATDPDREGEAIAWHITEAIKPGRTPVHRVVFQEITRNAVQQALDHPRAIDENLVNAQQARRVLDRLVGYQLSPLLWDKVKRGLSAGRVQSVAVRLIVEREQEVESFVPVEYWTIEADLLKTGGTAPRDAFRATLIERAGKKLDKFAVPDKAQADAIVTDLDRASYRVVKVTRKDKRRSPAPPFTTSTLQQEAGRKLGFSAKKTMMLAQRLYEGIDLGGNEGVSGLITYMRTDSTNVAGEAQAEARRLIESRFGRDYLPDKPPVYKTKAKGAQEAHEAIRPTSSERAPEQVSAILERDLFRLYELIWKRFVASQMAPAIFDSTTVDLGAWTPTTPTGNAPYLFRATGSVLKFPGFLAVYNVSLDEGEEDEDSERRLPALVEQDALDLLELLPIQHFTEPLPRFTEASLVKELERLGIGRPSTYASIISTIQERDYVTAADKKLIPTTLGRVVTELLVLHFPNIVDYDFTSALEQQLDDIADGSKAWVPVLHEFYAPFQKTLADAKVEMRNLKREEIVTDLQCPKCQQGLLAIKFGRNGEFLACTRYSKDGGPDSCDFTSDFHRDSDGKIVLDKASAPETSDVMCNLCGRPMVIKKSRFGPFLGCSGYPECSNTRRLGKDGKPVPLPEPTGVACPKCHEGELLRRRGRFGRPFFGCSRYPKCDYLTNSLEEMAPVEATPVQAAGKEKATKKTTATKKAVTSKKTTTSKKAATSKKTTSTKKEPPRKKSA